MGAAYYITAETHPEGLDLFVNGKALSKNAKKLAAISKKLGVADLMAFFSQNPEEAADLFDGDPADLPAETWFDAKEGLNTVRALIHHFGGEEAYETLVAELKEFETVLARLDAFNIRWHLSIDY